MRYNASEVVDSAAETITNIDAIRLPPQPIEGRVVSATVSAELQWANFRLGVVGVVDADESSAQAAAGVVYNL